MTSALQRFVAALPKVELHVHLEGSIEPHLALRLAARRGVRLPGAQEGVEGLRRAYRFGSFDDFLRLYIALSRCLQEVEDFTDACLGLGRSLAEQNVRYAEVTFTPMTHVARGVPLDVLHEGLEQGRAQVAERFGVVLRWVFDVVRSFPDQAQPTLGFALEHQRRDEGSVVGLGVGGPEAGTFDMRAIIAAFAIGRSEGLHSLPHAGEMAGPESIWTAVEDLRAERIGHGFRCLEDPELVAHLRREGIALEVCPSSNVALKAVPDLAAHPLPRLLEAGLAVSLGSDDPPLFGTDLVGEYVRCAETFGWDVATIRALAAAAVGHAFIDAEQAADLEAAQAAVPDPDPQ